MTPPALMEVLVEDDPASLFRAALVCKAWCRIISGAAFRRRFCELNRTPPLLGFICRSICPSPSGSFCYEKTHLRPTSTFRLPSSENMFQWPAIDTLHSRILFWDMYASIYIGSLQFIAWSPNAGEIRRLPILHQVRLRWIAVLVCATAGCRHLDCGSGNFNVVFVGTDYDKGLTSVYVYSSEQNVERADLYYSRRQFAVMPGGGPTAFVGKTVYFDSMYERTSVLLAYEMCKQELSVIKLPSVRLAHGDFSFTAPMTTDEGKLGLAMARNTKLFTWSWDGDAAGWALQGIFELDKILRHVVRTPWVFVQQVKWFAANGRHGVIVINTPGVHFTFDLKSGELAKIPEGPADTYTHSFHPYKCFCIPRFVCPTDL